jgi:hypothetical protein
MLPASEQCRTRSEIRGLELGSVPIGKRTRENGAHAQE